MREYNPLDGAHAFERVGLGKYPYTLKRFGKEETRCAFCGRPLTYNDGRWYRPGGEEITDPRTLALLERVPAAWPARPLTV